MDKDWLKIFSSDQIHTVELIRSYLLEHDIEAIVLNQRDSAYGAFGDVELYVHRSENVKAQHLVKSMDL